MQISRNSRIAIWPKHEFLILSFNTVKNPVCWYVSVCVCMYPYTYIFNITKVYYLTYTYIYMKYKLYVCACVLSHFSCVHLFETLRTVVSLHINTGMDYHSLFQGIFLTQGSGSCLLCFLQWQADSLPLVPSGKPRMQYICNI